MIFSYNYLTLEPYFLHKLCKDLKQYTANFRKIISFIKLQLLNSVKQFYFLNCKTFKSNHTGKRCVLHSSAGSQTRKTIITLLKVRPDILLVDLRDLFFRLRLGGMDKKEKRL